MTLAIVEIQGRAAQAVRQGYPWIFASQIKSWHPRPQPGDLVRVVDVAQTTLGFAYAHPQITLALRMLYSPEAGVRAPEGEPDEPAELGRKLDRAWSRRQNLLLPTDAYRVVWSEADGLPGFVCDRFGDRVVLQFLTAGMEARKAVLVEWVRTRLKPRGIFERSEGIGRTREGFLPVRGWLHPPAPEPELSAPLTIQEGDLKFWVDVVGGQKTGFYLDQRAARRFLQRRTFTGPVLDCFCYTGGLALSALKAGATRADAVDSSAHALETARANARINGFADQFQAHKSKVFDFLEAAAARGDKYELVILDPPAFTRSREHRERAMSGLRELHRRGAALIQPGGYLLTCSCSHHIARKDLLQAAISGLRQSGRTLKVRAEFGPDADHPEKMQIPESRYLTCLFAQVG